MLQRQLLENARVRREKNLHLITTERQVAADKFLPGKTRMQRCMQ